RNATVRGGLVGFNPSNFNPQWRHVRREDSDFCGGSAAKRRRPEQIIATSQFLRPEISAEISAKTVNLLNKLSHFAFCLKHKLGQPNQPLKMNL
ncbi:MAG: hypothetical protein II697_04545, partial [Clostridia bacterium]|nr:hypothetical protein [Clostridia bacterium]